jgi:hypothetical protein
MDTVERLLEVNESARLASNATYRVVCVEPID